MRIDLEQFLALTVALGTVGAVGTALYVEHRDREAQAAELALDEDEADEADAEEPEEVEPAKPAPVVAPTPAPAPEVEPLTDQAPLDSVVEAEEDLDEVPAPYVEGWWMNS